MNENVIKSPFRAALIHILETENWTQEALAAAVGCRQTHISALKRGDRQGSEGLRRKIAKAFGITYEQMRTLGEKLLNISEGDVAEGLSVGDHVDANVVKALIDERPSFFRKKAGTGNMNELLFRQMEKALTEKESIINEQARIIADQREIIEHYKSKGKTD